MQPTSPPPASSGAGSGWVTTATGTRVEGLSDSLAALQPAAGAEIRWSPVMAHSTQPPQPSPSELSSSGGGGTTAHLPASPAYLEVMDAVAELLEDAAEGTQAATPELVSVSPHARATMSMVEQVAPPPPHTAAPAISDQDLARAQDFTADQHEDMADASPRPALDTIHSHASAAPRNSADSQDPGSDSESTAPGTPGQVAQEAQGTTPRKGSVGFQLQRQDSNQSGVSGVSTLGTTLRKASEHLKRVLHHTMMGDDHAVHDKWDNYHDDLEEELEAAKRATSHASKRHRRPGPSSSSSTSKVHPAASAQSAASHVLMSMDGTSATNAKDLLGEKRSSRTLIWHYCQTFMFSMLLTAVCLPLIAVMSLVKWHEEVDGPPDTDNGTAVDGAGPTPSFYSVRPNHKALQLMLLFQIIFPLCIYAVLLYACIRRTFRLPWPMIALLIFTISWATLVCGLFYKFDVAFWFYYIDLFVIVAAYVPCMCMVGWYVEVDEHATVKQRLMDVFFTALLETVVAAATLVYCFFIMPLFFTLTSAWLQMLWLCVLHPLYFEATTGFIVRKTLHRNRQLGRNHILYLLTIVHSMVHLVVLATSLQASIEPIRILALTILLYNTSKMAWRSTVLQRDLFIERLIHGWSFNYSIDELAELSRMVSVGIITEIILENASIFIAPFMMFRMYKEPIFMAVVPNTFFNNGGTYPVQTLLILIAMLLSFTMIFDLSFYFLNYHMVQHLPLINTWRRIKRSQGWYLAFLVYAFASMGVLFLFLTMMILPRAAYCKTDNYCDCATLTYKTICEGQYISTLVDYLV